MLPGELFATLWQLIEAQAQAVILTPWHGRAAVECAELTRLIRACPDPTVPAEVLAYVAGKAVTFATTIAQHNLDQRAFVAMCALDDAAMDIHPARKTRLAGRSVALGGLLDEMKTRRTVEHSYAHVPTIGTVVPKGQLTSRRLDEESETANGANFASQFEHLTLVPSHTIYKIDFLVVSPYRFGLSDAKAQIVGVAPVAEDANDLTFRASARIGRAYLDARPTDPDALGTRLTDAVVSLLDQGAGVITLPELVSSDTALETLKRRLSARAVAPDNALVICGSGLSTDPCPSTGRHFNEATVMTGRGWVLFKQRKIHPFNMTATRMAECSVARDPAHNDKSHMEDIAASTTLTVCDLPDLGRVIVMICEDFEQEAPAGHVAIATRPDWIFTPVLDVSQEPGRWTHQRSIEIARRTLSRIVVTSSTTLTVRRKGLAKLSDVLPGEVGVSILYDGYAGRKVKRVEPCAGGGAPQAVSVQWDPQNWAGDDVQFRF